MQVGVILLTAMRKLTLPSMGIDMDSELTRLTSAYHKFLIEEEDTWMPRNVKFFEDAEVWLKEQGCKVDFFTLGMPKARWESESKRVEFYLRWM